MNLGTFVCLIFVILIVALAVRASFFKKSDSCCHGSSSKSSSKGAQLGFMKSLGTKEPLKKQQSEANLQELEPTSVCFGCSKSSGCSGCPDSATARNALAPIIKNIDD